MRVAINLAYCQDHHKGGDRSGTLPGALHARWLEDAVQFYTDLAFRELASRGHRPSLIVSATGFKGWPEVESGEERNALWQVLGAAYFVSMAANPGHQVGAAWCIRLGIEAATHLGFDGMIHTAEDVIPEPEVLARMVERLARGCEYVGEAWGPDRKELNCQFFGCRPQDMMPRDWDPTQLPRHGCIERYMAHFLEGRPTCRERFEYAHTHDYAVWKETAARRIV